MALSPCTRLAPFVLAVIFVVVGGTLAGRTERGPNGEIYKHLWPKTSWTVLFAEKQGYSIEKHYVKTGDHHTLTLHRITGNETNSNKGGRPVLLHHGFMGSAPDWLIQGPGKSLGFMLADQGFDVWLANARGSVNSQKHERFRIWHSAFWDWTFHDIGTEDIAAEIDYILKKTEKDTVSFVGFSLGATSFFALGATKPQYLKKVNKMVALGPIAHMEHVRSPALKWVAPLASHDDLMSTHFARDGSQDFRPTEEFFKWSTETFCKDDDLTVKLCMDNVLVTFFGLSVDKVNETVYGRIFDTSPAVSSPTVFRHLCQLMQAAPTFMQYNYGKTKNLRLYNQTTPPTYNTRLLDVPMYIYASKGDLVANEADINRLVSGLPAVKLLHFVPRQDFNHYDFLYASDAPELVFKDVVQVLQRRSNV